MDPRKKIKDSLEEIREETLTMTEALELLEYGVSRPTLISWCEKYNVGRKIGGRWYVFPEKLSLLLSSIK